MGRRLAVFAGVVVEEIQSFCRGRQGKIPFGIGGQDRCPQMFTGPVAFKIGAIAPAIESTLLPDDPYVVQLRALDLCGDLCNRTIRDPDEIAVIYVFTTLTTFPAEV